MTTSAAKAAVRETLRDGRVVTAVRVREDNGDEAPPEQTVRCGNRLAHGGEPGTHSSAQGVRECYAGRYAPVALVPAPAPAPEPPKPSLWSLVGRIPVGGKGFGYYARQTGDGALTFYRVERPTTGKHQGMTFVKRQSGGTFEWMRKGAQAEILAYLVDHFEEAGRLYAREARRCTRCNTPLTLLESRTVGMGSTCAAKAGL